MIDNVLSRILLVIVLVRLHLVGKYSGDRSSPGVIRI